MRQRSLAVMTFIMLMCRHHVRVLELANHLRVRDRDRQTILNDEGFAVFLDRFSFQLFYIDTALLHTHFEVSLGINDRRMPGNAQEWDLEDYYLLALDGTGYFYSKNIHCV